MHIRVQSSRISLKGPASQIVPLAETAFGLEGDIAPLVKNLVVGNGVMITGTDYSNEDHQFINVLIERIK